MRTTTPSRNRKRMTLGAGLTATALIASGCVFPFSGSDSTSTTPGVLEGIDQAQSAVVRIVAEGSYVDPAEGLVASAGSGSGFIVDSEGHVVTNAHVVEGAGLIRVYLEDDQPVNARILGVSECNDLAVLDLDGDGYSYVQWHEGVVDPGLEVYVAGFPLGDPEYSLTRGIVSKARADGASSWASLDYSIEHDAAIQPGNSGGPLLDADARIVGVNYAASDPTNTSQYFAIPGTIAQGVVDTLMTGQDVESLGINGLAWFDPGTDVGGIWVSGVRAGSSASNAGVDAGDILLSLAGRDVVTVSDEATKRGYCDVLRTQGDDNPMAISVYRPGAGEFLDGEINNPAKPLVVVGTTEPTDPADDPDTDTSVPAGFRLVTDSTGRLTTVMPEGWQDYAQGRITTEVGVASGMALSPDNDNFLEGDGSSPGVLLVIYQDKVREDLKDMRNFLARSVGVVDSCTDQGGENQATRFDTRYETLYYVDRYYSDCTDQGMQAYVATMWFPDAELLVGYVAAYNTQLQMEREDTILFNIQVN
jgi:serine protease Do